MTDNPPSTVTSRVRAPGGDRLGGGRAAHQRELKHLLGLHEAYRTSKRPGTVVVVHAPQAQTASRLVQEWRRELLRRGEQVFEVSCSGGGGRTYRALRELVASLYSYLEDLGLVGEELHGLFLELSACLGMNVGPMTRRVSPVTQPGQIYLYELLGRFLVDASQLRSSMLIVRDLDMADSATLAAVVYLAQNFALDPIDAYIPEGVSREGFRGMLALTLESGPGGEELLRTLTRGLKARPHAEFVDLRGVDEETVRHFLHRDDVVARFLKSTGGSPENLEAVLRLLPVDGESLLRRRLEGCAAEARRMLETLAVLGRAVSPDVLVQLSGLSGDVASGALAGLLEDGLVLRRVGRGELQVSFAQEQAVAVVYGQMEAEARRRLHGEVAEFLRGRQGYDHTVEVEEIAHHFLRSGLQESAASYALAAAERLHMTFAFQRARDLLEAALGLVEPEQLEGVYERLIDICSSLNEPRRALFYCGHLKRLLGQESGHAYRRIGKILLDMGKYDLAVRALGRALELKEARGESSEAVGVQSLMAEALYGRGEYDAAVEVCERGLRQAEALGGAPEQVRQEMHLTNTLGKVCLFREDYTRATHYFTENRDRAEVMGWGDEQVRALFNLGTIAVQRRNYERAEQIFLECLSFGHETANPTTRAFCLLNLAVIYQKTLRYEEALDCYLHSLATFKKSGDDMRFAATAMNLAVLYETLSDLPKAKALVDAALELTHAREMRYVYARNCYVRGKIALEEGEASQALEYLSRAREGLEGAGRTLRSKLALALAQAHHGLHQASERDRWRAQVEITGDSAEAQEVEGELALLDAVIAFDAEALATAESRSREARRLFEVCGVQDKRWKASFELARACRALGRVEEAKLHAGDAVKTVMALAEGVPAALRERYLQAPARQRLQRLQRALEGGGAFEERPEAAEVSASPGSLPVEASPGAPVIEVGRPLPESEQAWRGRYAGVIGEDSRLHHLFRMIDKVARSESTVLITGESGTGKEMISEAIHTHSQRAEGPLVKVNCAAFVETLLLSELFGHEKGAFTGALSRKKGRFELADGGTIFLDEIGDISMNTQVALLRILQERTFERVGGGQQIEVDVRVIAATNRNLEEMVREGTFRLDLYYRLKGVALELPPLRRRRGDIPLLVRHFTERFSAEGARARRFTQDALRRLARYNWPGNIRELENFVRSMLLFVESDAIGEEDIAEFEEFFAEGEMAEEAPLLVFAPGWWGGEVALRASSDGAASSSSGTEAALEGGERASSDASGAPALAGDDDEEEEDDDEEDEDGELIGGAGLAASLEAGRSVQEAIIEQVVFEGVGLQEFKKYLEVECIKRALQETDGNITHAARLLKMKRPRLSQIINAHPELGEVKERLGGG